MLKGSSHSIADQGPNGPTSSGRPEPEALPPRPIPPAAKVNRPESPAVGL